MIYRLLYFASLADLAGRSEEARDSVARTPRDLYVEVGAVHGFTLAPARLRVAVNGAFVDWDHALADNDEVVFLPPVSGG
jgi:molybdopterin converting factor small subunit